LEITKGVEGVPTVMVSTNKQLGILRGGQFKQRLEELEKQGQSPSDALAHLNQEARANADTYYTNQLSVAYVLDPLESMALTERLDKVVSQVEAALPSFLNLTNQLSSALSGVSSLTSNLNTVAVGAQPIVTNLSTVTAQLDHPGALGEWLLPTNLNANLDATVATANTNLQNLNATILNLADLTSNLNHQVQMNSNILSQLSTAVRDADDFVQGLKHHWLLRSAFKKQNTNSPPAKAVQPGTPQKGRGAY